VSDILSRSGSLLVRAIVQIAHTLGLVPVAEGLESAAQAEALAACGCDLAQGFHLGRPLDAEATRALILAAASRATGAHTGPQPAPEPSDQAPIASSR
jgi:EAL domain-containing protein (putative c-di-GMP-specific phosphodiesterase class I)